MFETAFERVFDNEGEFQNSSHDRGNWTSGTIGIGDLLGTKYGISAMSYPHLDIENLTLVDAREIYKRDWWDALAMESFRPAIQYQMFDAAINHGMHRATLFLQHAINTKADGVIGPKTKKAAFKMNLNDILMNFLAERLIFMTDISSWEVFGKGWARRIAHNLKHAAEDN